MDEFLSSQIFMPHGHCYLWEPGLVWLQVVSNGLIGVAYVAIAATLAYLVHRGQFLPFKGMALAFGIFIISCGVTHFFDVLVIWEPAYWVDGAVRGVTAVASVGTALMLPPLVPKAVGLARGAKAARRRGIELEAVVEDLATMYEKTLDLEQMKTQFFANVSHELRTPLTLILGPTRKLAADPTLSEAQRRDVDLVLRNARVLLEHVNDLLDVSKLEAGSLQPTYRRVDVAELVRVAAANFQGLADDRATTLTVETPPTLRAEVDRDQVRRVALNLLSNAFKFAPPGAPIRCALREGPDDWVLEVADGGPGVPGAMRETIFERFRQGDGASTRAVGGTGLGLAIVKDFVELHGGEVEVDDSPEGGALFRVSMPKTAPEHIDVADDPAEADADAIAEGAEVALDELRARVAAVAPDVAAHRPLVLVVEDNPDMNRFVCESLAPDYRTESAFDGRQGVQKALALEPDLVLTDLMMPRMDGAALVEALRRDPSMDATPIVLLTAKADDERKVELLREGAQDYLMKPFDADELKARVGNLVTMKRARDVLQGEIESQVRDLETLASQVSHKKRELHTALEEMRVAREQAEHASQLKTNFLGVVSHELRTPLSSLLLQLERMRVDEEDLPPDKKRLVGRMFVQVARLRELIEGLLQFARIESGRMEIHVEPFDAAELGRRCVDEIQPQADAKELALELDISGEERPLKSDPRLVHLVLVNLLGNAIKFTDRGTVTLRVERSDREHRFAVRDTGAGIPKEEQTRIFEPFEQIVEARRKHRPGVGLGLALVRELVTSLGGRLTLESELGVGTTFTVVIPEEG